MPSNSRPATGALALLGPAGVVLPPSAARRPARVAWQPASVGAPLPGSARWGQEGEHARGGHHTVWSSCCASRGSTGPSNRTTRSKFASSAGSCPRPASNASSGADNRASEVVRETAGGSVRSTGAAAATRLSLHGTCRQRGGAVREEPTVMTEATGTPGSLGHNPSHVLQAARAARAPAPQRRRPCSAAATCG